MAKWTSPLEWQNEGIEPSANLKQTGFKVGDKPAAGTFNYIFHNQKVCLEELQAAATGVEANPEGIGKPCTGKTLKPTYDTTVVADTGSEIFNDTRTRQFDGTNKANAGNVATGSYSHAEGNITTATGICNHSEGYFTMTSNSGSHAEGYGTAASGNYSHAEGFLTTAEGNYSHAEGTGTTGRVAKGTASHTEGYECETKAGNYNHAEGASTSASGTNAHAEGHNTIANGDNTSAGGYGGQAIGRCAFAHGHKTKAGVYQAAFGFYNDQSVDTVPTISGSTGTLLFVGNGDDYVGSDVTLNTPRNAFRITKEGKCYGKASFNASGADYAEYFEWLDGNTNAEDRRGRFVTLDGNKIRIANADDDYILGVVSANPSVVANCYADTWQGMHLKDVFGSLITETAETEDGTEKRYVLNPEYDPEQQYVSREFRPEWDTVGTHGQLVVIDDGTCVVDGYCQVIDGGAATAVAEKTAYKVVERLDSEHIRVFI